MANICERCGFVGESEQRRPGAPGVQIALFILGILTMGIVLIAWLGYGLWRLIKTEEVCPSCKHAKTMIAIDTPLGRRLQKQFASEA